MKSEQPPTFGVFVGRFNPIHLGHEWVIQQMLKVCGPEQCIVVIGSCNAPTSVRHFFSYGQRRYFLKQLFPELTVIGMPDFGSDSDWLLALDDLIQLSGVDPKSARFFSGSPEDVDFFVKDNRQVEIFSRLDGTTPVISATEVRDCLIRHRRLDNLLNPLIAPEVQKQFRRQWEDFKRI